MMYQFINLIQKKNLLTKFLIDVFEYDNLCDYNYMFRLIDNKDMIMIDIYDNVSEKRFNRYIYDFSGNKYTVIETIDGDVFVKKISVLNSYDCDVNEIRIAYLFNLEECLMIDYAVKFLDNVFVEIIKEIIK